MTAMPPSAPEHPLAPLLCLAREQSPDDRARWLAVLRAEAPTVVAALEHLMTVPRSAPATAEAQPAAEGNCRFMIPALRWVGAA